MATLQLDYFRRVVEELETSWKLRVQLELLQHHGHNCCYKFSKCGKVDAGGSSRVMAQTTSSMQHGPQGAARRRNSLIGTSFARGASPPTTPSLTNYINREYERICTIYFCAEPEGSLKGCMEETTNTGLQEMSRMQTDLADRCTKGWATAS